MYTYVAVDSHGQQPCNDSIIPTVLHTSTSRPLACCWAQAGTAASASWHQRSRSRRLNSHGPPAVPKERPHIGAVVQRRQKGDHPPQRRRRQAGVQNACAEQSGRALASGAMHPDQLSNKSSLEVVQRAGVARLYQTSLH